MTWRRWLPLPVLLASIACEPDKKDLLQLQRGIALLENRVRTLQRSFDVRSVEIAVLLQETLDRAADVQKASAAVDGAFREQMRRQEQSVAGPVAAIDSKMNRMTADLLALRSAVTDLHARLQRMQQQLIDMDNAVRIIPPPPPPSASEALGGPPAGVTAEDLFQAAQRDHLAGRDDLALQEFRDYLKYFGNTKLAASSQFHIGEIAFGHGDSNSAMEAFDRVLERYPASGKAPDALYLKAKVLEKRGRLSGAVQEFERLVRRYPNSDAARRAQAELKRLRTTPGTPRKPS